MIDSAQKKQAGAIEALLQEERKFPPSEAFRRQANVNDPSIYETALGNPEEFRARLGASARPRREKDRSDRPAGNILFTAELPKTRSGKIMRRLLRDIAEGRALGDVTTLADPAVVASLKERYKETES